MTIEQKAEFNQFVDSSIPMTWAKRWRTLKLTLPIWIFIFVCMVEMAILSAWARNQLSLGFIGSLVVGLPAGFSMIWGIIELEMWYYRRTKRTLTIKDRQIVMNPVKHPSMAWKSIARFQFEPAAANSSLTKLSIFGRISRLKRTREVRRFALIIESPGQVRELVQELETKQHVKGSDFKIVVLPKPEPPPTATNFPIAKSMAVTFTGFYIFLHGLPLIGIALLPRDNNSNSNFKIVPEQATKLGQFLAAHFSSVEQLRNFYLITGIALAVVGVTLIFLRMQMDDKFKS